MNEYNNIPNQYVGKKENNTKPIKIAVVVLAILLLIISGLYVYKLYTDKQNEKENDKIITNNNVKSLFSINDEWLNKYPEVKDIYNSIHKMYYREAVFFREIVSFVHADFKNTKIDRTNVSDIMKAKLAVFKNYDSKKINELKETKNVPLYEMYGLETFNEVIERDTNNDPVYQIAWGDFHYLVFAIGEKNFKSYVDEIFGESNGYLDTTVNFGDCNVIELRYFKDLSTYKLYTGEGCGGGIFPIIYGDYFKIKNIEKASDDTIYIYEKAIYVETEEDIVNNIATAVLYNYKGGSTIYQEQIDYYIESETADKLVSTYFTKYDSNLEQYKYTFKKNSTGAYYFDSVEIVK